MMSHMNVLDILYMIRMWGRRLSFGSQQRPVGRTVVVVGPGAAAGAVVMVVVLLEEAGWGR